MQLKLSEIAIINDILFKKGNISNNFNTNIKVFNADVAEALLLIILIIILQEN